MLYGCIYLLQEIWSRKQCKFRFIQEEKEEEIPPGIDISSLIRGAEAF